VRRAREAGNAREVVAVLADDAMDDATRDGGP
jgi:hypothetical protein